MEMEPEKIVEENERRKMQLERPFRPVTGKGSIGARRLLRIPDFQIPEQWIPVSLWEHTFIQELREAGSLGEYARKRMPGVDEERVKEYLSLRLIKLRCLHDFPFWCATFVYIKRKGGGDDVLFRLNRPQRMLVERLESIRLAGRPIRLILLKARQWGGSTCAQLYMAWLQLVVKRGLNSLIIAHQGAASDEIKDMFDRMMLSYPAEMLGLEPTKNGREAKKTEHVGKSGAIFRVPARNCKVKIGTAERPDSCRGGDYNLVHCSEVGIWKATDGKTPEMILRSACSGILLQPLTMIVYESTANGTGNFFHREYEAAKRGESQFESMFVSWFDIEQYSMPLDDPYAFAARLIEGKDCETTSSGRAAPGAYLWRLWEKGATLEALNWYVAERAKFGEQALMAAEYPTDDIEAFVHSGMRVFDRNAVERMREDCREPAYRGDVAGRGPEGKAAVSGVRFFREENGPLSIWAMPDEKPWSNRYLVVVDIGGRSSKADWSVAVVIDRAPMAEGNAPEVVAQWRGHVDIDVLAWKAASLAAFYGNALLVFESNTLESRDRDRDTEGDQTPFIFSQLRDVYINLYARVAADCMIGESKPRRYGFHTNTITKPMVITALIKAVREGLYIERDNGCIEEMLSYEKRQNGSFGAISGCHDDILMTRAIGMHICYAEMEPPMAVENRWRPRRRPPASIASF